MKELIDRFPKHFSSKITVPLQPNTKSPKFLACSKPSFIIFQIYCLLTLLKSNVITSACTKRTFPPQQTPFLSPLNTFMTSFRSIYYKFYFKMNDQQYIFINIFNVIFQQIIIVYNHKFAERNRMDQKHEVLNIEKDANPQQTISNIKSKHKQRKYHLDSILQQNLYSNKNDTTENQNHDEALSNVQIKDREIKVKNNEQTQFYEKLQDILNHKTFEQRNAQQNLILAHLSGKNQYLKFLTHQYGSQFVKGILKTSKLLRLKKDKILVEQGQPNLYSFLVLEGQLGLTLKRCGQKKTIPTPTLLSLQLSLQQTLEKIVSIARAENKSISKIIRAQIYGDSQTHNTISSTKSRNATPLLLGTIDWDHAKDGLNQVGQKNWIQKLQKGNQFGLKSRCYGKTYESTAISLQDCILLKINITHFMHGLNVVMAQKLKTERMLLKGIACFKKLPDEKLQNLVYLLVPKKSKRNEFIYKQGKQSTHLFILMQGQIKLNKDTNLFVQNPNTFYINRNQLVTPPNKIEGITSRNKPLLPYAQLSNMYNYHPKNKLIQIGVISPVCLFGEEQMIQARNRQTNAICISQTVSYYQIQFSKLEQVLGKQLMPQFLQQVKLYTKNKVLSRQDRYANNVQLENINNLDYFYYDGEKQVNSPRKFNIFKINQRIQPNLNANLHEGITFSQQFPPQYTTFNFHKMKSKQKHGRLEKLNLSQLNVNKKRSDISTKRPDISHKFSHKNSSRLSKEDTDQQAEQAHRLLNQKQLKIVEDSHTWIQVKAQVKRQIEIMKKISPIRPSISLNKPLFEPKYFKDAYIRNRKIQKQFRTKKLSLGNSSKRLLREYQ